MTKKTFACVCLLAVLAAPAVSLAGTVWYTTTTPIPSTKTDWTGTLAFPKFDSSMGTLTSVELKIDAALDTTLTVNNTATSDSSGWAKTEVILSVQDSGNHLVDPVLDMFSGQVTFTLAPGASLMASVPNKTASSDKTYTDAATLAAFTGLGDILLNAGTQTFAIISYTGGNTEASQVTHASATGMVTYTFETPEPAALSLLASGVVFLRRRRTA